MTRIDASDYTFVASCACGYRGMPQGDKLSARRDLDRHRRLQHPEQARDVAKKRRRRGFTLAS